jgi:hypothetical protein
MEDFRIEPGPVHDDGALVGPDLRYLRQLGVPLQRGQAGALRHIRRVYFYVAIFNRVRKKEEMRLSV